MRFAFAIFFAAFLAWLATFSFDCYYHGLPVPQPSSHPRDDNPPFPGDTADNLFWFMQISDIHISVANDLEIVKDFTTFCSEVVSTVNPALVLVTGKDWQPYILAAVQFILLYLHTLHKVNIRNDALLLR